MASFDRLQGLGSIRPAFPAQGLGFCPVFVGQGLGFISPVFPAQGLGFCPVFVGQGSGFGVY